MKFLFDCEDEIALPAAYNLVSDIKPFLEKLAAEGENEGEIADKREARKAKLNRMLKSAMVLHPGDTSKLLAKMWILEEIEVPVLGKDGKPALDKAGKAITRKEKEKAPSAFKTISALFFNEVAVDFFTSAMPSLLVISKQASQAAK